ncbi:MAG TPA: hypothetical protein VKZ49_00425 [Polyangiaceae bacterium]|nr:hypothetical protein [Polyangiaceae bacterium]
MRLEKLCYPLLPLVLLGGCTKSHDLEPAANASEVEGLPDAAFTSVDGVQVVAQAGEWPEDQEVLDNSTPIYIEIINGSGMPLRIEYRHFSLASSTGATYAALPPFRVQGTPTQPSVIADREPVALGYRADGFKVAPYYGHIYEEIPTYDRPFVADQAYYGTAYSHWSGTRLREPSRTMKIMALPEGVLEPGGHLRGYVYFPRLPAGAQQVEVRFNAVDADTGDIFAIAAIPFVQSD